jgi:hypothetical protein
MFGALAHSRRSTPPEVPITLHTSDDTRGYSHQAGPGASNVQESATRVHFVDEKESDLNVTIQELRVKEGYWRSAARHQLSLITATYCRWNEAQSTKPF